MDYSTHIDTISLGFSILNFKCLLVIISIKRCMSIPPEDCFFFILANSADSDRKLYKLVFDLDLDSMQNEKGHMKQFVVTL